MCFLVETREMTAKADFPVWKIIVRASKKSLVYDFVYHWKTTYRLRKKLKVVHESIFGSNVIDEGFHSYFNKKRALNLASNTDFVCVVEMTVPKGAKYYLNTLTQEIVSTSIRTGDLNPVR